MSHREQALQFDCGGETLVGIVSAPREAALASDTGVVIVIGGPQYRAGSHRQFVLLARAIATQGHHCLRFDYRGMGDSSGAERGFEQVADDIDAAVTALRSHVPQLRKIALWGLCDGASASLMYLNRPGAAARIHGLCLANPWVRSTQSLARAQVKHYYRERLMQRSFWLKLLRGGVALTALRSLGRNLRLARGSAAVTGDGDTTDFRSAMAGAWRSFKGPILLLLSGHDLVAREFAAYPSTDPAWAGALEKPGLVRHDLSEADHTFSDGAQARLVESLSTAWLDQLAGRTSIAESSA